MQAKIAIIFEEKKKTGQNEMKYKKENSIEFQSDLGL